MKASLLFPGKEFILSHDRESVMFWKAEHDDVIKWKHFLHYWPFVRGSHRSPVNSPHKGQWRRALLFSLICTWKNGWVNNGEAADLRRHHAHYDVIIMKIALIVWLHSFVTCVVYAQQDAGRPKINVQQKYPQFDWSAIARFKERKIYRNSLA